MTDKNLVISTIFSAILFCGCPILAQEPIQDINPKIHPNLAAAQGHLVQANNYIISAQADNNYDMGGHAEKARKLLAEVNKELKLAAETANAVNLSRQKH